MDKDNFLRLWQVIGSPRRGIDGIFPISKSKLYLLIASGRFPAPVKLGRSSLWKAAEVRAALEVIGSDVAAPAENRRVL